MSFTLDDLVIDRIQIATAENSKGELLYTLTQLSEATIETTAESKEAKSAEGSLIKKFYQGKAGTFTATNAMINLNVIGAASGTDKQVGGASEAMIQMPKIKLPKKLLFGKMNRIFNLKKKKEKRMENNQNHFYYL